MNSPWIEEHPAPPTDSDSAEREEVRWLLTPGVLGRSANLRRVLSYICEETFQGRADQIREKTIAIEALGRRPDFNPQIDTIVRVTVRMLRKRLLEVYEGEAADHPVHVVLPPGSYAPSFGRPYQYPRKDSSTAHPQQVEDLNAAKIDLAFPPMRPIVQAKASADSPSNRPWMLLLAAAGVIFSTLLVWSWTRHSKLSRQKADPVDSVNPASLLPRQDTFRALIGSGRSSYVDHSGNTWIAGDFCKGGTNVVPPTQKIAGTEDPMLYLGGQRGITHCEFPVADGLHEMHFYFAELGDLAPATSLATLSINAGPHIGVDVVDRAGGAFIATSTVVTNIPPENDGAIHLEFISEVSPLTAVEILPAPSANLLPVRIVSGTAAVVDDSGKVWGADRYFLGGRHGQASRSEKAESNIYASNRIGNFRYVIPVLPNGRYRINLYFLEPWFRDGKGGPGSRVFNVSCNGRMLLQNLDILAEADSRPLVKSFEHVYATAGGTLELSFTSVTNYPLVNAIEVIPEAQ